MLNARNSSSRSADHFLRSADPGLALSGSLLLHSYEVRIARRQCTARVEVQRLPRFPLATVSFTRTSHVDFAALRSFGRLASAARFLDALSQASLMSAACVDRSQISFDQLHPSLCEGRVPSCATRLVRGGASIIRAPALARQAQRRPDPRTDLGSDEPYSTSSDASEVTASP